MQQTPIKFGIIAGMVSAAILYILYTMDVQLFLNPLLVFAISVLVPFLAMVRSVRKVKEANADGVDFKTAVRTAFITWILSMLIFQVFMHGIFTFDTSLTDLLKERIVESQGPEAANEIGPPTIGASFQRFLFMLLPGFLFAYMVASFLKNKR